MCEQSAKRQEKPCVSALASVHWVSFKASTSQLLPACKALIFMKHESQEHRTIVQ